MRQRATTSTIPAFSPQRTYRYGYDSLSRLTRARYSDSEGGAGRYDTRYSYDLNGNLTSLVRRGALSISSTGTPSAYGAVDSLTLEYAGNRLRSVSDASAGPHYQGAFHFVDGADEDEEYRYDLNGNTVTDLNRGILSSRFDTAEHPARMDFADGSSTCWLYDDAGTKLRTLHRVASVPVAVPGSQGPALTETVTDYCAGFVYEDSLLTRINLDGAYLSYTGADGNRLSAPEYHFYLRDHLGNNRVDVAADGRICQVTDYYPYGLPMASSRNAASQRWLFGGKELDRISGLDLYDFEARVYDPTLARFTSHDAFEEKYYPLSPYLYCAANPLRLIDPDGNHWVKSEKTKEYQWMDNATNAKNTPEGYKYIGKTETHILNDLGIPKIQSHKLTRYGVGIAADEIGLALIFSKVTAKLYVVTKVETTENENAKSDNNISGKTMEGLSITAIVNQTNFTTNPDYSITYEGGFSVKSADFNKTKPLKFDNSYGINKPNTVCRQANILLPAKYIGKKNIGVSFKLGGVNPLVINRTIDKTFKLKPK